MDWSILGIDVTKDKKKITQAYRQQLVKVNPEDKPDEFKALRAAYEEAMRLADQEEVPDSEKSPVERWMDRVSRVYHDFPSRVSLACWQELLHDEVCIALDSRPQAENALLKFFMEEYALPQEVWQLLEGEFRFSQRLDELYESYPRDFVDYVLINGAKYEENLPLRLFVPGEDAGQCDEYRRLYNQARRAQGEERTNLLQEMDEMREHHPYGDALILSDAIANGDEGALEQLVRLSRAYPDDNKLALIAAQELAEKDRWGESEAICKEILERMPEHNQATWLLAQCLAAREEYSDAIDLVGDLMNAAGGDQKQLYQLNQVRTGWNNALIEKYTKIIEGNPDDNETKADLAWCYLQNDRNEEAWQVAQTVAENQPEPYRYAILMAQTNTSVKQYEQALPYLEAAIAMLRTMEPDGTKRMERRLASLPDRLLARADLLSRVGREEESQQAYQEALDSAPENPELLTYMARISMFKRQFEQAAEYALRLTRVLPDAYHGYLLLAHALYELHNDRDAFDALNRAMDIDSSDLGEYVLKMQILLRNDAFDQVREILDLLKQHDLQDVPDVRWCEAQLTEFADKDTALALEQYTALAKCVEEGAEFDYTAKLYFRMTCVKAETLDMKKQEDRDTLMALLEKGLAADPEDLNCLDYKAWLLKKDGKRDEALEIYHNLEERPRRNHYVERQLADLYYDELEQDADLALKYYSVLLEDNPEDPEILFYVGMCRLQLGDLAGAEEAFLAEQKQEPDVLDGYHRLSYVYEAMGRNEEALEQADKTIDIIRDREGNQSSYYLHKAQILRRLRRPHEAVAVVQEAMDKYGYKGHETIFEIYTQFALWGDAKAQLKKWRKSGISPAYVNAVIRMDLLKDKLFAARMKFVDQAGMLNQNTYLRDRLDVRLSEMEGKKKNTIRVLLNRLKEVEVGDHDGFSYNYMSLASACHSFGDDSARDYAEKGLQAADAKLSRHLRNEALYRSRRALLLALLGRKEEAYAELAAARALPLCRSCPYDSCKDADLYEAQMAEIFGDPELSRKLAEQYLEKWPDEEDFVCLMHNLKRKGH